MKQKCAIDDDTFSSNIEGDESISISSIKITKVEETNASDINISNKKIEAANIGEPMFSIARRLSCKWTSGTGPRIGCVRDYPAELQCQALEKVNLSPRVAFGANYANCGPIPSPRPSSKARLSPRISYIGLPSPRTPIASN